MTTFLTIPRGSLQPSPWNPRQVDPRSQGFADLVESIRLHGVLQPLLVRDLGQGGYQIVAGERRWRAAEQAGLEGLPCLVRELSDQEAVEATVLENMQREDLTPLEEARGVRSLLEQYSGDHAAVGVRLNRSASWVARRAQLLQLTARWRELLDAGPVEGEEFDPRGWPVSWLEEIARLPVDIQDDILSGRAQRLYGGIHDLDHLRRIIGSYQHALEHARWDLADDSLPGGACTACAKRTGCQALLFEDAKDDRCLDAECFERKRNLCDEIAIDKAKGRGVVVVGSHPSQVPEVLRQAVAKLPAYAWQPCKKDDPGAQKVAIYDEHKGLSRASWMRTDQAAASARQPALDQASCEDDSEADEGSAEALQERLGKLQQRRLKWICSKLVELLADASDPLAVSDAAACMFLAAVAGADSHGTAQALHAAATVDWQDESSLVDLLWNQVTWPLQKLLKRLARTEADAEVVQAIAEALGQDWSTFWVQAERKFPRPKSWGQTLAESLPSDDHCHDKPQPQPPEPEVLGPESVKAADRCPTDADGAPRIRTESEASAKQQRVADALVACMSALNVNELDIKQLAAAADQPLYWVTAAVQADDRLTLAEGGQLVRLAGASV